MSKGKNVERLKCRKIKMSKIKRKVEDQNERRRLECGESYVFRLMTLLSKSISSTKFLSKHFVDKILQKSISSTEHFVDKTFCRQIFVDRTLRRQNTSSTGHFVDKTFCRQNIQLAQNSLIRATDFRPNPHPQDSTLKLWNPHPHPQDSMLKLWNPHPYFACSSFETFALTLTLYAQALGFSSSPSPSRFVKVGQLEFGEV